MFTFQLHIIVRTLKLLFKIKWMTLFLNIHQVHSIVWLFTCTAKFVSFQCTKTKSSMLWSISISKLNLHNHYHLHFDTHSRPGLTGSPDGYIFTHSVWEPVEMSAKGFYGPNTLPPSSVTKPKLNGIPITDPSREISFTIFVRTLLDLGVFGVP